MIVKDNNVEKAIRELKRKLQRDGLYAHPRIANPGNIIDCGSGGGGNMGNRLCHENEAPFPEQLAEFFVRSFCPPDGVVCDPYCGSGTTIDVAVRHGRNAIGIDVRASQLDLTRRRMAVSAAEPLPLFEEASP